MKSSLKGVLCVLMTAIILGLSGTAQSLGNSYMGVFTFNSSRSLLGVIFLIPLAFWSVRSSGRKTDLRALLLGGVLSGAALWGCLAIQQYCLKYLMVGKVTFLMSLYVLIVPVLNWRRGGRPGIRYLTALALVTSGLYLLCLKGGRIDFSFPELLMLGCAACVALQITVIDRFIEKVDCFALTAVEFITVTVMSVPVMLVFETPHLAQIAAGWKSVLYAGFLSTVVGYSFQAVGQRCCSPLIASLVLSLETVFAVIGAWILLDEAMNIGELAGCALMFAGTAAAQLTPQKQ